MADYQSSLELARAAGYSWGDIQGHLAQATTAADDAGYTQDEIDAHLGFVPPATFEDRARGSWATAMADDPTIVDSLAAGKFDLGANTSLRSDYVDALRNNEVKGPLDFAERTAAQAVGAATDIHGLQGNTDAHLAAAASSAAGLAPELPSREDLADATVALTREGVDPKTVRENLLDHWKDTGQGPVEAAVAARSDPSLAAKLISTPLPPVVPDPPETFWPLTEDQVSPALASRLGDAIVSHFQGIVKDWSDWADHQEEITQRLAGKSLSERLLDPETRDQAMGVALSVTPLPMLNRLTSIFDAMRVGQAFTKVDPTASTMGEALTGISREQMAVDAAKQGPVHEAAAEIANMSETERAKALEPEGNGPLTPAVRVGGKVYEGATHGEAYDAALREHAGIEPEGTTAADRNLFVTQKGEVLSHQEAIAYRAQVAELVPAYQAAKSYYEVARDLGGLLMRDETGAIPIRTAAQQAAYDLYGVSRDEAQKLIITAQGRQQATMAQFADILNEFRGLVAPHEAEFARAAAAHDAQGMANSVFGQFYAGVEGMGYTGPIVGKMAPLGDAIRNVNDVAHQAFVDAYNAGKIDLLTYRDNYYRHLWKDPRGPEWENLWTPGVGKQGSAESMQMRTLPTMYDGLKAGLEPRLPNPIDNTLFDLGQKTRYLAAIDVLDQAQKMGLNPLTGAPGYAYYAHGPISPGDIALKGIATKEGGLTLFGTEGFARSYNNWLDIGLYGHPTAATTYEKLLWMTNTMTGMKLALPTFHMSVVGLASWASTVGRAMEEFGRGQVGAGIWDTAKALTIVGPVIEDTLRGTRQMRAYAKGLADPTLTYLTDAGLRVGPRQSIYRFGPQSFQQSAIREGATTAGAGQFGMFTPTGARGILKDLWRDVKDVAGDTSGITETPGWRLLRMPDRVAQVPIKWLGRIMNTVTDPLFDHAIPALKVGAGYGRMQSWLQANTGASPEAVWARAREIVKDVDNRYGELNQDTIFWRNSIKQAANVGMVSTGWVYGSYRGFAGALGFNIDRGTLAWNPTVTASTIGTAVGYMYANAVAQYLHTGTAPWQTDTPLADALNYRTGAQSAYGTPERGMVPSELKEVYDLFKAVSFAMGTGHWSYLGPAFNAYAAGKANPFWQAINAFRTGEDGIGHKIANTPGGWEKYLTELFNPIVVDAIKHNRVGTGISLPEKLMGWREAARYVSDPPGYQASIGKLSEGWSKQELRRAAHEALMNGEPPPEGYQPPQGRQKKGPDRSYPQGFGAPSSGPQRTPRAAPAVPYFTAPTVLRGNSRRRRQ